MFPSNVDLQQLNFDATRRIRCNSWTMPWKRSATVWPSFISVSWSVLVYQLDLSIDLGFAWKPIGFWACRWFGCLKNFLYFGMLLGFPKIHYIITWKVEPISSALPALIFKAPSFKSLGTNVGTRVIPPFSIAASKLVFRRSVGVSEPS